MAHQRLTDAVPLVLVDHRKRDFGLSGAHDNVTSAAGNHRPVAFFEHRHQGYVIDEIHIQKEGRFLIREATFWDKEATAE